MAVRSMTGFARARRSGDFGEVTVTVRTVNHRALDLHTHLPAAVEPFESDLRAVVKRYVLRGHVDLRVSVSFSAGAEASGLNRELFAAYLAALETVKTEFGIDGGADVNAALRIPGMLASADGDESESLKRAVLEAAEDAFGSLNQFRDREGLEIASVMLEQSQQISLIKKEIEGIRTTLLPTIHTRLKDRLNDLLQGMPVDPQRLAQEAALLIERSDVYEETARLGVHAEQVIQSLKAGGETGKKLDFLLQEMNRETNTILSKTSGLGDHGLKLTELGLQAKSAIEKIREQAANLE